MAKFRKRPVVIEARQYTREGIAAEAVAEWSGGTQYNDGLHIQTPEGEMLASYGDWVICGVKGEFYPCKPDIFESIYEEVR